MSAVQQRGAAEEEEVSEEVRSAHRRAFDEAFAVVQTEVDRVAKESPDQQVVLLRSVRNDFEAWEEGTIDGPIPPMATADRLRQQILYVMVDKASWTSAPDYKRRVHQVFDAHMGGGTSLSPKLFALFRKGLAAVRSALRGGSNALAFAELISLTKAMKDDDDWYGDTDAPEQVVSIVASLGKLWSTVLEHAPFAVARQGLVAIRTWLDEAKQEWEGEAATHIDARVQFNFEPVDPPMETPQKTRAPKRPASGSDSSKRKAAKMVFPRSDAVDAWAHQLDGDLLRRQSSAVQLRCEGGGKKRAIVVSGSYPLKAVGFALAEAFGVAVDVFDPHPNKGKSPPTCFTVCRDGAEYLVQPALKIVQAAQEPGDQMTVHLEGLTIAVSLDLIKLKAGGDDLGSMVIRRPMPRCVGGDGKLTPQMLKRLNKVFLADRKPSNFLCCTKKEQIQGTVEDMGKPLALRQGEAVDLGVGGVDGWLRLDQSLQPLSF